MGCAHEHTRYRFSEMRFECLDCGARRKLLAPGGGWVKLRQVIPGIYPSYRVIVRKRLAVAS